MVNQRVRRLDKDQAVAMAMLLIAAAFLSARLIPVFLKDKPLTVDLTVSGIFLFFSYNVVNALIGGAIKKTADDAIDAYKRENSPQHIVEKQNNELRALTLALNNHDAVSRRVQSTNEQAEANRFHARKEIVRKISEDNWEIIALEACLKTLGKSDSQIDAEPEITLFWKDITIYLKAWLVLSIDYDRALPIEYIRQHYPNDQKPAQRAYIKALSYVRDKISKGDDILSQISHRYRTQAVEVLREYLNGLIEKLRELH